MLLKLETQPALESIRQSRLNTKKLGLESPQRRIAAGTKEKKKKISEKKPGRLFRSTDGYDILVGVNAADNDAITFKTAKSSDTWLHAADYPGSHVLIRNPNRTSVPRRTILEAAQLAAYHSEARKESKAAVNYTLKKFVTKPPRSALGLVRLSSFKTILVEPKCALQRQLT